MASVTVSVRCVLKHDSQTGMVCYKPIDEVLYKAVWYRIYNAYAPPRALDWWINIIYIEIWRE